MRAAAAIWRAFGAARSYALRAMAQDSGMLYARRGFYFAFDAAADMLPCLMLMMPHIAAIIIATCYGCLFIIMIFRRHAAISLLLLMLIFTPFLFCLLSARPYIIRAMRAPISFRHALSSPLARVLRRLSVDMSRCAHLRRCAHMRYAAQPQHATHARVTFDD